MSRFKRGLLIAFEGLDRSGKTTQAQLLKSFYESQQKPVHLMRFPVRSTETGKKIDEHLKSKREYTHEQIHELFSLNRWEMRDEMLTRIQNGTNIILDRYAYSGVAYSVAKGLGLDWCKKHDKGLPKPDFVFYLDLSVEEAMTREGFGLELFERKDFQNKVRDSYRQLFGDEWIIVPANKSAEEVHKEIVLNLEKHSQTLLSASQTIQQLWIDA